MPTPSDPHQSSFAFLTKIKYGGPLGKLAALGIAFLVFLGCMIPAARNLPWLLAGMLLTGFAAIVFMTLRIEALFKANPKLATLEGREVLRYLQIELKSRNHPAVPGEEVQSLPSDLRKAIGVSPETVLDERTED
jgi:hypothetical protein